MKPTLYSGSGRPSGAAGSGLPAPLRSDDTSPEHYLPDPGLVDAANTALLLGMPLLLTGEPGTGKTRFAHALAWELGLAGPFRFDTKSTSVSRDLLYAFDALACYRAAQLGDRQARPLDFIRFQALGQAILAALDPATRPGPLAAAVDLPGPVRAVVLVDEIDKAPRDFPNDLLFEIEEMSFRIAELEGLRVSAPAALRPVVILTSNSERQLPDAFLRRCVYHHLPPPDRGRLEAILGRRLRLTAGSPFLRDALDLFEAIRADGRLARPPATAELLDWIRALRALGPDAGENPLRAPGLATRTLGCLAKTREDVEKVSSVVRRWSEGRPA